MENIISVRNLSKKYKDFSLNDVSFDVKKGSVMGFVGKNGAGKTTTIKSILGSISKDEGNIDIFGMDNIQNEVEIKEQIGVVYDSNPFPLAFNPKKLGHILSYFYKDWNMEIYNDYLKRFEIKEKMAIYKLSKGTQMKLQLATALSHKAKLLIMDEPTSGLDPVVRSEVLEIFDDYVSDSENTILISSHLTSDLERICDYITFIDGGEIILSESSLDLTKTHKILKIDEETLSKIDESIIIGKRKSSFQNEVMVKCADINDFNDMIFDMPTIEDIMVFYSIGRKANK